LQRSVIKGAAYGCVAWLAYGSVEFALSLGLQLYKLPDLVVTNWQWRSIGTLFGIYAAAGVILGAIAGLVLRAGNRDRTSPAFTMAASLTLVLAFLVNLIIARPLSISEYLALAVSAGLALLFLFSLVTETRLKRARAFTGPLTLSLFLLGAPWLSREALGNEFSSSSKLGMSMALLVVVAGAAALWHRVRKDQETSTFGSALASAAIALAVGMLLLVRSQPPSVSANDTGRSPAAGRPNIVLITMDTVRADHLSVYGYERDTTPNLRDFARTSTVYDRAIATWDATLPTHASIFTGMYPAWHGAIYVHPQSPFGRPLSPDHLTLASALAASGYSTAETAANSAYLAPWTGLTRGFDVPDVSRPATLSSDDRRFYLRESARRWFSFMGDTAGFDRSALTAQDINRRAFTIIDREHSRKRPFFLFLNYMDAHSPYTPEAPFNTRFPGRDRHFNAKQRFAAFRKVNDRKVPLTSAEKEHLLSQYDGGIAQQDDAIGDLLRRLKELSLFDDSLIVITADHGELLGEHDLLEHALGEVYEGLVHVPLMIKVPGQKAAARSEEPVSQIDIMPTILDAVKISPPARIQGRSLRQPASDDRAIFSESVSSGELNSKNPRFRGTRYAVFSGPLKLIAWSAGPSELYDLVVDAREEHNFYSDSDPRASGLLKRIESFTAAAPHENSQSRKLTPSTIERLKSLGYVQ
jgi:arylsulfatase A-like enzyme